jgi:hypothetical protein
MKAINLLKQAALLITAIFSFTSCPGFGPGAVQYRLGLSYTDIYANDLVRGLAEVDTSSTGISSLYKLQIVLPEPCTRWSHEGYNIKGNDTASPKVEYMLLTDHSYCLVNFILPVDDCPQTRMLTHKVKCPELFGDDAVREIVSWWDIPKAENAMHYAECYLIEFEGNEIVTTLSNHYTYLATITLTNPSPPPPREEN